MCFILFALREVSLVYLCVLWTFAAEINQSVSSRETKIFSPRDSTCLHENLM